MSDKLLLTGATGFVGQACMKLLKHLDFEIHAISRNPSTLASQINVQWHQCDILNSDDTTDLIKKIKPQYLIHLAWYVEHQLFWSSDKNINYIAATVNLYKQFSEQGGIKGVFVGSCAEYDSTFTECDEEQTPLIPQTLYGIAKKHTYELLCQLKKDNPHFSPFSWVRIFNIFGEQEHPNRLIPYIINSYLQNKLPQLNNPFAIRDHLYIDNLAQIILGLLKLKHDGAVNAGQGTALSILELNQIIQSRYFKNLFDHTHPISLEKNFTSFIPNLNQLNGLNIQPKISFEEGLDRTFHWWQNKHNIFIHSNMAKS